MFSGYLTVADRCEACGLDYGFADAGDGAAQQYRTKAEEGRLSP